MQTIMYDVLYYVYILFFGTYVSVRLACGSVAAKEWKAISCLWPALLMAQGIALYTWGIDMVWRLYPAIVHLPILLTIIFLLKVKWDIALISVMIAYSLCQPLRWIGLVLDTVGMIRGVSLLIHLCLCQLLLMLFNKFCAQAIHHIIVRSARLRRGFGALPVLYYIYEYFLMYMPDQLVDVLPIHELLPTAMVLFFILFSILYQRESEKGYAYEKQALMFEAELSQASNEIKLLRTIEEKTAIHRHDLRHHLLMIDNLLAAGKAERACAYVREAIGEMETIAPVRYCENELFNLLISDFKGKADSAGIAMTVKICLPPHLSISDTELCAVVSNGLENAINAVSALPEHAEKWIDLFVDIKQNHLLMEIKNPCISEIAMQNGLPVAENGEVRYGCRSIQSIVQRRRGNCIFDAANGLFVLRIAIPLKTAPSYGKTSLFG